MKSCESTFCKCLYFSSQAFARKVEKLAIESWKPAGLSPSHAYLLMLVLKEPGIQPTAIGEHLQLSPSTITRLSEKLEEKKLLVRVNDGKLTNIYPTPKGKSMETLLNDCLRNFYQTYSSILGKENSSRLVADINTLTDKL
jgi:DNA-binding MarR family transcriptional regulator